MRVKISDVARRAGVSTAVVSYVLNDGPRPVSPETRERVLKAIKELDYRPFQAARRLRSTEFECVGFVVLHDTNFAKDPYVGELLSGVAEACWRHDLQPVVHPIRDDVERVLRLYSERIIDGSVVVGAYLDDSIVAALEERKLPFVLVGSESRLSRTISIVPDHLLEMKLAVEHLVQLGHEKIGYIGGNERVFAGRQRKRGFIEAMRQKGLAVVEEWLLQGDWSERFAADAAKRFARHENRPSAIVAASDRLAIGAMKALQRSGIHVPRDIAIVGCDDIELGRYVDPPLTTVKWPIANVGVQAVESLLAVSRGNSPDPRRVYVQGELVRRRSCGGTTT